jgi:hypothetical protein
MPSIAPKRLAQLERYEREVKVYHDASNLLLRHQERVLAEHPPGDPWRVGWIAFSRAWCDAIINAMDGEARPSDL